MLIIREATLADVEALARIRAAGWGSEQYWQERIAGYMRRTLHPRESLPERAVFVSEDSGIAGLIAGHLTHRFDCDGELQWLDVVAGRRRTGIAEGLFRMLAQWFADRAATRVCVDVDPMNGPARALYQKHGAEELSSHWLVWPDIMKCVRR